MVSVNSLFTLYHYVEHNALVIYICVGKHASLGICVWKTLIPARKHILTHITATSGLTAGWPADKIVLNLKFLKLALYTR